MLLNFKSTSLNTREKVMKMQLEHENSDCVLISIKIKYSFVCEYTNVLIKSPPLSSIFHFLFSSFPHSSSPHSILFLRSRTVDYSGIAPFSFLARSQKMLFR